MKSQPQDQKIRTNCKNCVFAVCDSNTQTGCLHNRIEKYGTDVISAYDNDKEFYVIDRLCTYYRDVAWGYSSLDIDKVENESAISFDLIFDCGDLNKRQCQAIIDFINYNNYYSNKLNIVLMHENHKYETAKEKIIHITSETKNVNISVCLDVQYFMYELLKKTKNAYHCLVNEPENLDIDILNQLNDYVNEDLGKFIFAQHGPNKFIGNFKYKSLNDFNPSVLYFKNIEEIEALCQNTELYITI